jgi:putative oxidoreductase
VATGRFILRAAVGGLMMGHGLQKLQGRFGGPGLEGTEQMMGAMGMHPAKHQARAAALSETIGGGLTAAGFLSPLGPAMIIGTMAVAIKKVHGKNGLWVHEGGYEYNLTLIAASLALAAEGPGVLSLDALLRKHRSGLQWAIVAAALGLGGAAATLAVADRMAPSGEPADEAAGPAEAGSEVSTASGTA